jgi:hypothetical protein
LEQDHREVEEWFDEYDELNEDDNRKAELAEKICMALKIHAQIEEEIFYPQIRIGPGSANRDRQSRSIPWRGRVNTCERLYGKAPLSNQAGSSGRAH